MDKIALYAVLQILATFASCVLLINFTSKMTKILLNRIDELEKNINNAKD